MRVPQKKSFLFLSFILLAAAGGCRSAGTIDHFQSFAETGITYTAAVDSLLADTSSLLIDANSVRLLENRRLEPVSREDFREQDEAMRRQVRDLRLLQREVDLLGRYFDNLTRLAGSNAPGQLAQELETLGSSLGSLSTALGETHRLAADAEALQAVASGAGRVVVRGAQSRSLRRELAARGEVVARILRRHAELLTALTGQAERAQGLLDRKAYEQKVISPFLTGGPLPEDQWASWMKERRDGLTKSPIPDSLRQAVDAAESLRLAWTRLLAGEPASPRTPAGSMAARPGPAFH